MPSFVMATLLLLVFALQLGWLPSMGNQPGGLILPIVSLSLYPMAYVTRLQRSSMLDVLGQDYIRTARAKGLREKAVIYSHAFRNALIPVSTVVVGTIFSLFAGSTITETIFAWNGIGKVLIEAINKRDIMQSQ